MVGYWFYVLQNRRNAPLLAFRSFSWALATQSADSTDPDLVIWFRGVAVPRLTRTQIALWNPGRTVIQEADISDVDPLEFGFRHGKVLEARLVRVARSASKVEVSTVNERARVSFDFLDHRDGLLIDCSTPTSAAHLSGAERSRDFLRGSEISGISFPSSRKKSLNLNGFSAKGPGGSVRRGHGGHVRSD